MKLKYNPVEITDNKCPICNIKLKTISMKTKKPKQRKIYGLHCINCNNYFFLRSQRDRLCDAIKTNRIEFNENFTMYVTKQNLTNEPKKTKKRKPKAIIKQVSHEISIVDSICPLCFRELTNVYYKRENGKTIAGLYCNDCEKYFFSDKNYNELIKALENRDTDFKGQFIKYKPLKLAGQKYIIFLNAVKIKRASYNKKKVNNKVKPIKESPAKPGSNNKKKSINSQNIEVKEIVPTAIILSENRLCTKNNHYIIDVIAVIRVWSNHLNKVINRKIPATYCEKCSRCFIYKLDYDKIKKDCTILVNVVNGLKYDIDNYNNLFWSPESRIHQLGYNVRVNNGLTDTQRHIILANAIENASITKYEILNHLYKQIDLHYYQSNYEHAVSCWENDIEFLNNYKTGDIPEILIDNISVGKRI